MIFQRYIAERNICSEKGEHGIQIHGSAYHGSACIHLFDHSAEVEAQNAVYERNYVGTVGGADYALRAFRNALGSVSG